MRRAILVFGLVLAAASTGLAAPGHLEGHVPAVAHVEGRFGSFWTSDVWIYQQGATVVHLWFNRAGQDNSDVESVVVSLDGPVTRLPDIVARIFATEGVGSLHYLADGPVTVTSRTWSSAPDGGGYGQTIEGVPLAMASVADAGQAGALRMVADHAAGFRSNLGLVNVSSAAVTVAVELFGSDGDPAPGDSSFTVTLQPFDMTQRGDVLARLGSELVEGAIIRVSVTSDDGAVLAYLSTVDNSTNDASYQPAFRFGG
jgi:hypothetical protein